MGLTKLSLFSGILGDDLASEWAGIKTVCCVEINPSCHKVIKEYNPNMPIIGDIHDVTKAKVEEVSGYDQVDIISGGDPCQPRSVAGKRRGKEDDRDLWKDMLRVVQEFKPAWVVNENPTGRLTMDFHEVLFDLESIGYETRAFIIPACAVNANHRRERLFIVANSNLYGLKRRGDMESKSELANGKIKVPATWDIPCYSFKDWEKLNHKTGSVRRYDGISGRMVKEGIRQFGNAVVPQQVYPIYKAIVEVEGSLAGSQEE
jgi:DNA (cytosine-5)-methyltransferase 1